MSESGPRLIVGIGNRWRGDDAAGLVAARLARDMAPADVEVLEWEGEPVGLLDRLAAASLVVVIDAVYSGAAPGTVHRLEAQDAPLPAELGGASTHAFGLADTIELGRALGRLPGRLVIFGIEGGSFGAGEEMCDAVQAAVKAAAVAAAREVDDGNPGSPFTTATGPSPGAIRAGGI